MLIAGVVEVYGQRELLFTLTLILSYCLAWFDSPGILKSSYCSAPISDEITASQVRDPE